MTRPVLDILLPLHDQPGWVDIAIRSIESFTDVPYRLILIDNASELGETKALLKDAENRGHTVLRLPINKSFSNAINAGALLGEGKFLCIFNSDAIATEGWAGALVQDATPRHIGMVGAKSNYASGAQMDPNFVGEPPYLVMVCVCLRREVFNAVGPLDEETFDGFSSEDIDYAWRVRKAGYKLAVSSAYVLHAGSRTLAAELGAHEKVQGPGGEIFAKPMTEARARNDAKYNQRLIDKWGIDWVKENQSTVKRVLVTSFHPEEFTRVRFMDDFVNMKAVGGYAFNFLRCQRVPIAMARNQVADIAVDQGYDYLLQLDDDATFPPDVIRRLLAHQKPFVAALAYQRKPPHLTCAFEVGDDGLLGKPLEGIEHTGLRKVDVTGQHCTLTHTSVFKKLRAGAPEAHGVPALPGTRHYFGWMSEVKVGEDFAFCLNCKKLGIPIYVDTELITGHIGAPIVVDENYKRAFMEQRR